MAVHNLSLTRSHFDCVHINFCPALKKNRETACLNAQFYALWIPRSGPKVCGGENGGAAGARMSRLTSVISRESKLINNIKNTINTNNNNKLDLS